MCMMKCPICKKDVCSCFFGAGTYIEHLKSCGDQWTQGKIFAWQTMRGDCHYLRGAKWIMVDPDGKECGSATGFGTCLYKKFHEDRWYKIDKDKIEEEYKQDNEIASLCEWDNCPRIAESYMEQKMGITYPDPARPDSGYKYVASTTWDKDKK